MYKLVVGETEGADVFDVLCGVSIVAMWGASGPNESVPGCHTVLPYVWLAEREVCVGKALLVAVEEEGFKSV